MSRVRSLQAIGALALGLVGCATAPEEHGNRACIVQTRLTSALERCMGTLDVVYSYRNPPHPGIANGGPIEFRRIHHEWVSGTAEAQSDENSCYAAALVSSFAALEVKYRQAQFRQAISDECFGQGSLPLTFSQIVFAATKVHLNSGGVWYVDLDGAPQSRFLNMLATRSAPVVQVDPNASVDNGALYRHVEVCQGSDGWSKSWSWSQLNLNLAAMVKSKIGFWAASEAEPQQVFHWAGLPVSRDIYELLKIDLYRGVEWQNSGQPKGKVGGIYPIRHSGHLAHEVAKNVPVLAGLKDDGYGHVVLVSGISFHGGKLDHLVGREQAAYVPDDNTYIEWVEVVDPARLDRSPYKISGDEFLLKSQFLFSMYHPR